jgi:hypothetical protein
MRYVCFAVHLVNSVLAVLIVSFFKRARQIDEIREDPYFKLFPGLCLAFVLLGYVGFRFGSATYFSYVFLNLLLISSFALFVSFNATMLLLCLLHVFDTSSVWKKVLLRAAGLALAIWSGWLISGVSTALLADHVRALREGPLHVSGTVVAKRTSGWRWTTYSVTIDDVYYEVRDRAWWSALHRGQKVDFLSDPGRTLAFGPGAAVLTPLATVATVSLGALWLMGGALLLRWLRKFLASP